MTNLADAFASKEGGFPRPIWEKVEQWANRQIEISTDPHAVWNEFALEWLEKLSDHLGPNYGIHESPNFWLLDANDEQAALARLQFLEYALSEIFKIIGNVASDEGFGKHIVLSFLDDQKYYEYISHFYPEEGAFGLSGGIFVNEGYGHIVLPPGDVDQTERAVVYQLTHASLSHLESPLWLHQALACFTEGKFFNANQGQAVLDIIHGGQGAVGGLTAGEATDDFNQFWAENGLDSFWDGESFLRDDEGQGFSFNLASMILSYLLEAFEPEAVVNFIKNATYDDGGKKAAIEYLGVELEEIGADLIGADPDLEVSKNSS